MNHIQARLLTYSGEIGPGLRWEKERLVYDVKKLTDSPSTAAPGVDA